MPDSSDPRPPDPEPGAPGWRLPASDLSASDPSGGDPSGSDTSASNSGADDSGADDPGAEHSDAEHSDAADRPPSSDPAGGGWTTPGAGQGWTSGPGASGPGASGPEAGGPAGPPGGPPHGPPGGSNAWSGWTSGPSTPPPGQGGWGASAPPHATWRVPDAKPGVIPLRPLGVGEIVDGAITTVRRNPLATIGLAAIVGAVTALVGLVALRSISGQDALTDPNATPDEVLDAFAATLPALGLQLLVNFLANVVLTGLLTVVVGQAVIGRQLTIGEAWTRARPRMWRLVGLTVVYSLLLVAAFAGVTVVAVFLGALVGGGGGATLAVLGFVAAFVLGVWLFVRYFVAVPSLMLESEETAAGLRPVRILRALSRSAALVRRSWWRTFGVVVLIIIIYAIVTYAINIPVQLIAGASLADPSTLTGLSPVALVLISIGQVVATAIAAPFFAAATVLLYIDLRIRREGLDLELARAAGVSLPGRGPAGPFEAPPSP